MVFVAVYHQQAAILVSQGKRSLRREKSARGDGGDGHTAPPPARFYFPAPVPTGTFYPPQVSLAFKKKEKTRNRNKMAARRFRRSTATTTRRKVTENGGLWSGNEVCFSIADPTYTLKFLISPCFQKSDKERKGNVVMTTMQLQDSQP